MQEEANKRKRITLKTVHQMLDGMSVEMAEKVHVNFEITSDTGIDEITLNMNPDYLPYPKLISFQNFEVPFYNDSMKPHQTIHIPWDDEFAKGRSIEMIVDM
jgi:hypothetical protein